MKYKSYVAVITKALKEYKELVDSMAAAYKQDRQKIEQTAKEMQGKWTQEYIEKYKRENNPIFKYKKQMQEYRARYEPTVIKYLEFLKKQLDDYFNAPVKAEFANKINAIKISGLKLSNMEFKLLQDTATSYMERRLLEQLAMSRTSISIQHAFDTNEPDGGRNGVRNVEVADPCCAVELPDIESMYKAFRDYEHAATGLLRSYAGPNAELTMALDNNTRDYIAVSMDAYFRCNKESEFIEHMDKANSILPESKVKRELTENDRKLIDVLVDPKYPTLAEKTVKEIAEISPELTELFALDDRYSKYLETDE